MRSKVVDYSRTDDVTVVAHQHRDVEANTDSQIAHVVKRQSGGAGALQRANQ